MFRIKICLDVQTHDMRTSESASDISECRYHMETAVRIFFEDLSASFLFSSKEDRFPAVFKYDAHVVLYSPCSDEWDACGVESSRLPFEKGSKTCT
jgi:hypothetical protein